jgi:signal transduction histidine kinase
MKGFLRETHKYAILLIVLLAIASIAVWQTLSYLQERLATPEFSIVGSLVWILTLGFMLIAGAFGLVATRSSAQREGRRRVGQLVDAMDYIHDGLMVVDRTGRVTGSNPAIRKITSLPNDELMELQRAFPCLSESDVAQLVQAREPVEIERPHACPGLACVLRFRAQPSGDMVLVLISDVTAQNAKRRQNRQVARLQLIGQIARGVAHDFNNILCVISGNASLLQRMTSGSPAATAFLDAISQSVERGSAMATHLVELARAVTGASDGTAEHESLRSAVVALENSLPPEWSVESTIEKMDPAALSEVQVEQVVLNIGLHAAEGLAAPGVLHVYSGPPSKAHSALSAGAKHCGVVLISTSSISQMLQSGVVLQQREVSESGVILSVVSTLVEEVGGTLDLLTAPGGILVYRVLLPRVTEKAAAQGSSVDIPKEQSAQVVGWKILHARAPGRASRVDPLLDRLNLEMRRVESVADMVATITGPVAFQVLLIDKALLEREGHGILCAVLRLVPATGVVVLGEGGSAILGELAKDVLAVQKPSDFKALMNAILEARSLALQRK